MKGKGKTPQDKEKGVDVRDCPLQFPDLDTVNHEEDCPRYSQVLGREDGEGVTMEELDSLQADMEALLASVGRRLKLLEAENSVLNSWPDKKDAKKPTSAGKGTEPTNHVSTPTKRKGTPTDDKERPPSKKAKDKGPSQPSTPTNTPRSKGKNAQQATKPAGEEPTPPTVPPATDAPPPLELPKAHKNDAVNRFWAAVEPFCQPITPDDIKVIEEMLKTYDEETEFMKIPPLGVHYTKRWAEEDLLEEQNEGAKIGDKKKPIQGNKDTNTNTTQETATLLKKAEIKKNDHYMDDSPFGPLTQRLVSALIEDNLMTPMDDSMADTAENADEAPAMSPKNIAKQFNIGNPATLERRIRKELEEQGILEKEEEEEPDDPADEVLAELRRKQQELKAISQQNAAILRALRRQAQDDVARHDLRRRLQAADSEVMDAYRKIQNARLKKKSPSKKEREAVIKALKDRDSLIKALEM